MTALTIDTGVDVQKLMDRITNLEERLEEVESQIPANRITIIVFSGDLDRVLASLVIGTGALALGMEVSYFFTFWGITTLKDNKTLGGKTLFEKMMTLMTPAGTKGMGVSKMNYFGVGAQMLRSMMKENNVESVESLFQMAKDMGATLYSCTMSQDVMGIESEELIDGTVDAGAVAMLSDAVDSKFTLFI